MRKCILLAIALVASLAATRLHRAAPGVIVFTGGALREPIVLSDWDENMRLMGAMGHILTVPDSALTHRRKFEVAMYWGQMWSHFAHTPDSLEMLRHVQPAQYGVFYPATTRLPALWVFGPPTVGGQRSVTAEGIGILERHRVPTH
jgi:hypothetical protein